MRVRTFGRQKINEKQTIHIFGHAQKSEIIEKILLHCSFELNPFRCAKKIIGIIIFPLKDPEVTLGYNWGLLFWVGFIYFPN